MRVTLVEWSFKKSPELTIESWAVAATIEAMLRVLALEKKQDVQELLSRLAK